MLSSIFGQEPSQSIVLINGTLIDGTGTNPVLNAVVVIQAERIIAVGTKNGIIIPSNVKIVDAKDLFILPGFINAHVHKAYHFLEFQTWAQNGVTTVRDLGTHYGTQTFSRRDDLLKNSLNARLVAAGPIITTIGGFPPYSRLEVSGSKDARQKVNELIDDGADLIKVMIEDNLGGRSWPMLSMSTIKIIVKTARDRGKLVSAHITRAKHLKMAIEAEVGDLAHMIIKDDLSKELVDRVVAKDIYWIPTLELWKLVSLSHKTKRKDESVENLRRFVRAGGKVALGTDFRGFHGSFDSGMPITERELMQEAGMTPMQIIVAGTKHAALYVTWRVNWGPLNLVRSLM